MTDTKFKEGNKEATKRGKNKRTLYLNAIAKELGLDNTDKAEEEFYKFCVKVALGSYSDDAAPDTQLLKECLSRLYPQQKSTLPLYEVELPDGSTRLQKAEIIAEASISGVIPADVAKLILDGLADVARVEETDVLANEIKRIKEQLGVS